MMINAMGIEITANDKASRSMIELAGAFTYFYGTLKANLWFVDNVDVAIDVCRELNDGYR